MFKTELRSRRRRQEWLDSVGARRPPPIRPALPRDLGGEALILPIAASPSVERARAKLLKRPPACPPSTASLSADREGAELCKKVETPVFKADRRLRAFPRRLELRTSDAGHGRGIARAELPNPGSSTFYPKGRGSDFQGNLQAAGASAASRAPHLPAP